MHEFTSLRLTKAPTHFSHFSPLTLVFCLLLLLPSIYLCSLVSAVTSGNLHTSEDLELSHTYEREKSLPVFSSNSFCFPYLGFEPFEVSFVQSDRYGLNFIHLHVDILFSNHHLLKMFSFLQYASLACLSNCGFIVILNL